MNDFAKDEHVVRLESRIRELEAELGEQQRINAEDRRALQNAFDVGNATKAERDALAATIDAVRKHLSTEDFYVHDVNANGTLVGGIRAAYAQPLEAILDSSPAQHQTERLAKAWDEGAEHVYANASGKPKCWYARDHEPCPRNPYRTERGGVR